MENNNLNSRDEYNLFLFFENIWKNKLLLTLILLIFAILGVIFNYSYPYLNKATPSASINFLVTDLSTMHDILLENNNNPKYEFNLMHNEYDMFVMYRLNDILSSSNNFENWKKSNKSQSKNLSIYKASKLYVLAMTSNITVPFISKDVLNSIISYLSFSTQVLSDQIIDELKRSQMLLEIKINNEQNNIYENYNLRIIEIDLDIINKTALLTSATEELDFIEKNITQEIEDSFSLNSRILNLTNTIKVNNLIIENLNKRKNLYLSLEIKYNQKLIKLNEELDGLIKKQSFLNNNIPVRLGEINVNEKTLSKRYSLIVSIISFVFTGLIFGIIFLYFKEEYKRHHDSMKLKKNKI